MKVYLSMNAFVKAYLTRFSCAVVDGIGVAIGISGVVWVIAQFI